MKKIFKNYLVVWTALLVVYNVIVFSVRALPGFEIHYDTRFWIAWGFFIATYLGQLFCAYITLNKGESSTALFNILIVKKSYIATIVMMVASTVCMIIPNCPPWITAIVCVAAFGFSVATVIKTKASVDLVGEIDKKIKTQTFFVKSLTVDADTLVALARSEAVKAECVKVYEAARYSDPMSSDALSSTEGLITLKLAELREAVEADDIEATKTAAHAVLVFIRDRNNKCKMLK